MEENELKEKVDVLVYNDKYLTVTALTKYLKYKFDVDEQLETPFDFSHFKRAMVYVKRYKWRIYTKY